MPETTSSQSAKKSPDYAGLVKFLVQPFLEVPDSLRVDCEVSQSKAKVWVRLAFEGSDKGRVFGRGGRNIQAIRAVLEGVAQAAGHSAYLDVFGGQPHGRDGDSDDPDRGERPPSPRRSSGPKGAPKLKPH